MKDSHRKEYDTLCSLSRRAHLLEGTSRLLSWDQETYMPKNAAPVRAEQLEILAELAHNIKTSPEYEKQLSKLIDLKTGKLKATTLEEPKKAALTVFRHDFVREKKLPTSFVQEFARVTSESIFIWQNAKSKNDFKLFLPHLERILKLVRKKADLIGYKNHPYDALIDEFEPGTTTQDVDAIFDELKTAICPLIAKIKSKEPELEIAATEQEQLALCRTLLDLIGFDFDSGRIDVSAHPFSSSYHPYDSRITTRAESHGIITQILTTLHEAGHSFYEMGLPVKTHGTPLSQAVSLGVHESQSRFWETRIGRSMPFCKLIWPILQKQFGAKLKKLDVNEFYRRLNLVTPSLIRTDADEVTYPLHVILRFEIEKQLVEGSLKVKELPDAWRALMKQLLGVVPRTDAVGCLQDIHWSMGAFGYFPTYSLGNVYAAQMFEVFAKEHPDWEKRIQKGQFDFVKQWLSDNVWKHGRRYDSKELIKKISKKPLSAKPFITYLTTKYNPRN